MARMFVPEFGFAILVAASGCSVMMAQQGTPPATNLAGLQEGLTRAEAELLIGAPIASIRAPDGRRIDIYEVNGGTPPDSLRALLHTLLDLSTLFAWEIIGTPVEATIRNARNPQQLAIVYGWDDRVVATHRLGYARSQPARGDRPPSGAAAPAPVFGVEGGMP